MSINLEIWQNLLLLNDGVSWFLDEPNIQVFLLFTIKITASHLKKTRYNPYQLKLWKIIKEKHDTGMGYRRISDWLNKHGYKTPRGKKFKNNHVFSILKKRKIADERMLRRYEPIIENLKLVVRRIKKGQIKIC